jgi:hypothetical protein
LITAQPKSLWLYRALVASLALHVVLFALIPPFTSLDSKQSVELLSFVRAVPIRIQTPRPHAQLAAAAPVHAQIANAGHVRAASMHVAQHASRLQAQQRESAPRYGAVAQAGANGATPGVTAMPAQTAPPQPTASAAPNQNPVGGMMPLGAEEPTPVLDPSVQRALAALGVHVTLTVNVDSEGHTQRVDFAPPLDANVEDRIRTLLASASWDPAVCGGGVTCAGQAVIRL